MNKEPGFGAQGDVLVVLVRGDGGIAVLAVIRDLEIWLAVDNLDGVVIQVDSLAFGLRLSQLIRMDTERPVQSCAVGVSADLDGESAVLISRDLEEVIIERIEILRVFAVCQRLQLDNQFICKVLRRNSVERGIDGDVSVEG